MCEWLGSATMGSIIRNKSQERGFNTLTKVGWFEEARFKCLMLWNGILLNGGGIVLATFSSTILFIYLFIAGFGSAAMLIGQSNTNLIEDFTGKTPEFGRSLQRALADCAAQTGMSGPFPLFFVLVFVNTEGSNVVSHEQR